MCQKPDGQGGPAKDAALANARASDMTRDRRFSQLRDHFRRIPVRVDSLNLAVFVHFDHIDAFEADFAAIVALAATRPFHRGAIAGHEHRIFGEADALEVLAD